MAKQLPRKNPVKTMATLRRSAMMGAAATALVAVTPVLQAATPAGQATTPRAAVREILGVQQRATARRELIAQRFALSADAILIENTEDITVGVDETAIPYASAQDSVSVVNTGDLTGGIGIDVYTGAIDPDDSVLDLTQIIPIDMSSMPLFDEDGNPVLDENGFPVYATTYQYVIHDRLNVLARDPLDSAISVENEGSISFAGRHGIKTVNPAGQSITITNSGEITSTQDTGFRSGIYASTETIRNERTGEAHTPGEFTYNSSGQLTGVVVPEQFHAYLLTTDMEYDGGAISIHNTANIDMGETEAVPYFGGPSQFASVGIYTRGDGGTTIVNSGDIQVGKRSSGIHASSTATTSISNSGRIDVGNLSSGISFAPSTGSAGDYRLGGDVYVLNTGEIHGGISKSELEPYESLSVTGIHITSLGSNNEYMAGQAHINALYAQYNEMLGGEVYELFDIPNTRLYATTGINRGHIELADGGHGISIIPFAGDSTAVNEGTIVVGDGNSYFDNNVQAQSAGLFQTNFPVNGLGSTTSINTATGVIITGDDSAGIANLNIGGTSIAINEGSITTGNGVFAPVDFLTGTYDRAFRSYGIFSTSSGPMFGTISYARNSGDITVGELAVGVMVSGQGYSRFDPYAPSAMAVNEGIVTTGDDSTGMFVIGTNTLAHNSGSVIVGDLDLSEFNPHPEYRTDVFENQGHGVASSGEVLSDLVNDGTITTGNGTVGAMARMYTPAYGIAARMLQGESGVIITGDDSTGAKVAGNYYGLFENQGEITVGDDSIGVDVTAGSVHLRYGDMDPTVIGGQAHAVNTGIVETGDNSVGVRLNAVHEDVVFSGHVYVDDGPEICPTPDFCYQPTRRVEISGSADSVGSAYLLNAGTIRVDANSTAVEITGEAANEMGLHLFNTGTIEAPRGGAGIAVNINAHNALGSYMVNVGTVSGDLVFGAGDDHLMHTAYLDSAGALVSTGNLLLDGTMIDFGAGANRFDIDRAQITLTGGQSSILGADLFLTGASIEARNGAADSSLLIDGSVSGSLVFGADFSRSAADQLFIAGDVTEGSAISLMLTPTTQLIGESTFTVITIDGENDAGTPLISGVTGQYADSLQSALASFDQATGEVTVTAIFGMGHLATAASAATTMAQNWWMQSVASLDKRDAQKLVGAEDTGISVWGTAFHDEGTVEPGNANQDVSFNQKISSLQSGIQWSTTLGGGSFSIGPMISYGNADANLNANLSSASGDAFAYGLNANYRWSNGLYVDAVWQKMDMDIDTRAPGTATNARGSTDAEGDGLNLEVGYVYQLKSGLSLAPQLQYANVDVDLNDFDSSDGVYSFAGIGGESSLLRAGLSVFKTFKTGNGSITPLATLSYLDVMDGDSALQSNGVGFENDTTGSGYRAEFGIAGRYKAWDIAAQVGLMDTSAVKQALTSNLTVRYRW